MLIACWIDFSQHPNGLPAAWKTKIEQVSYFHFLVQGVSTVGFPKVPCVSDVTLTYKWLKTSSSQACLICGGPWRATQFSFHSLSCIQRSELRKQLLRLVFRQHLSLRCLTKEMKQGGGCPVSNIQAESWEGISAEPLLSMIWYYINYFSLSEVSFMWFSLSFLV